MKFFSKKKKDNFIIDDDIPAFTIEFSEDKPKNHYSPNVLTPEEILGMKNDTENVSEEMLDSKTALESLRKKVAVMTEDSSASEDNIEEITLEKAEIKEEINLNMFSSDPIDDIILSLGAEENDAVEDEMQPDMIILADKDKTSAEAEIKEEDQEDNVNGDEIFIEEFKTVSLLDKCQPYIIDENGEEVIDSEPLYKLQSVAEILRNDSEKTLQNLYDKYDISFDDLGHGNENTKVTAEPEKQEIPSPEPTDKKPENRSFMEYFSSKSVPEKQVFEDKMPVRNQVKNIQSNVANIISDIDIPEVSLEEPQNKDISNTATITFTPVSDGSRSGSYINVSTQTRPIDLTGELVKLPSKTEEIAEEKLKLEKNEFEDYVPEEEIKDEKDAVKFIRVFSIKRRRAFLQTFFSVLLTLILSVAKLPFLSEVLLSHTTVGMIVCSGIMGLIILCNYDMFAFLPKIFSNKCSPDSLVSSAAIIMVVYAVFGILASNIITDMLLLFAITLSFRALCRFFKSSYMVSNLKIITQSGQKRALKLIDDNAVTMAMAKNSIEGEVLIAAPQKAEFFEDYMKYATFGNALDGKLKLIAIFSLILSIIVGITCAFYFDGVVYGFYAAAAMQCFAALPTVFLIDNLPLFRTAKKLNRKGAMICGKSAALNIEKANAAVLNACDIFPSGTVTLHQMKVLSDNNLEDTIIRAASLTESLGSPLTPIFKKIAGTGNITVFPDSDTVKYEDKMGISGWVDNRLLFIGNRTLMEAHGIEVPPIEVDRKILMQGFFPVYVATRDKACALLVIQYNVDMDVANELRRMTNSGITLLVNSCDPNLTEEMISDYFGLYLDTIKVMTAAGCHMYRNTVTSTKTVSAPAAFRSNPMALISIINCASRIKRSNFLLTIVYLICAILGAVIFAYVSLGGSGTLISENTLLIYGIVSTVVSYLAYFIERP